MIIDQDGTISIITQEKSTIVELINKIQEFYPKIKNNNLVIFLNTLNSISEQEIAEFLLLSNSHRKLKFSFVIVSNVINLDNIPDALVVVPTLQEAYDIIEMDEMERDLGF